jgi:carboxymethylenebutenolidase
MGELVHFASNGSTAQGYLARPASGTGPGVIVLQEWWGLVPHIQEVADRFAAAGFVALAPDLFHGEKTTSPDEAGRLFMALDIARTERDLAGAVTFLRQHARGDKVGVVGFCMGGQLALFAATKNPEVGACIDFYGVHPKVHPDFAQLGCPVLGFFGASDSFVTPEVVGALKAQLEAAGKQADFTIYPDAGHAFFNDHRPEAHVPHRAQEAWDRSLAFLRRELAA